MWGRRAEWQREPVYPKDALDEAEQVGKFPIILADQSDNPGGGAPSDSVEILQLFIDRGFGDDCLLMYMRDPETVQQCKRAGVGAKVDVMMGGKAHVLTGPPIPMTVEVQVISDGKARYEGPMWTGKMGEHGDTVLVKMVEASGASGTSGTSGGIQIVVTSAMQQPVDMAFAKTLGLDCTTKKYICLKSTGHFRSGFGPIAGQIFNVDAKGAFSQNFKSIPFKRLGRKVYPMDPDTTL